MAIAVIHMAALAFVIHAAAIASQCQDSDNDLPNARDALKEGRYDEGIEVLLSSLEGPDLTLEERRTAYLVLSNLYWQYASAVEQPYGQASVQLKREAEQVIRDCLSEPPLRDTTMEGMEYPNDLILKFQEIRGQMFGGLRLSLPAAYGHTVILDVDTLLVPAEQSELELANIPVGEHALLVEAEGKKPYEEELFIESSTVSSRTIELDQKRGFWWYATGGALLAGAAVLVAVIVGGQDDSGGEPEPLPTPPDPPALQNP